YEPGSFVPMLRIDQGNGNEEKHLSAYITDALGTPLQLLSPNGQPRWLAEPDDWAAVTNQRAVRGVTQPIRFQGQWHDEESGLYYNRHRYYDPEQGRYISQDPIGLNGGTNLYGYVTNPTGMVDPLGLFGSGWSHQGANSVYDSSVNNQIINTCISDVEDWMKVPDYSGAVNTRNSVMAVLSRKPGVGFFAQFLEAAAIHDVCAYKNNNGDLRDPNTGQFMHDFEIWPGPVPEDAHFDRQIGVPSNPRSAVRKVLKDGGAEASKDNGVDINPYQYTR
ncbi:RHS repeat-associated core domain-containing protein, partial [Vreelandella alkaliphila]